MVNFTAAAALLLTGALAAEASKSDLSRRSVRQGPSAFSSRGYRMERSHNDKGPAPLPLPFPGEVRSPKFDLQHSQHWNYHHGFTSVQSWAPPPPLPLPAAIPAPVALPPPPPFKRDHIAGLDVELFSSETVSHVEDAIKPSAGNKGIHLAINRRSHHHHHGGYGYPAYAYPAAYPYPAYAPSYNYGSWSSGRWVWASKRSASLERRQEDDFGDDSQLPEAAMSGYVAVAAPIAHSSFASSSAGLVFSLADDNDAANFTIGTSSKHSNTFSMVFDNSSDSNSLATLRVPMLDAKTMSSQDYCATFPTINPKLSLEPCSSELDLSVKSQSFLWNFTTGELVPQMLAIQLNSEMDDTMDDASTNNAMATSPAMVPLRSTLLISTFGAEKPAPASKNQLNVATSADDSAPDAKLYFIPSQAYASNQAKASPSASTADDTEAEDSLPTPATYENARSLANRPLVYRASASGATASQMPAANLQALKPSATASFAFDANADIAPSARQFKAQAAEATSSFDQAAGYWAPLSASDAY